jgi:hypothetical protein
MRGRAKLKSKIIRSTLLALRLSAPARANAIGAAQPPTLSRPHKGAGDAHRNDGRRRLRFKSAQ